MKKLLLISLIFLGFSSISQEIDVITQEKTQGIITILSYSPDGALLASGSAKENSIKIWDINSGKIIGKLEGHDGFTTSLMFNSDGSKLISSANDDYLILWDVIEWKMIDSVKIKSPFVSTVLDATKADLFYAGSKSGFVQKWSFSNLHSPEILYNENFPITRLACSENHLASGNSAGRITVYHLGGKEIKKTKKVHQSAVKGLEFYDDGKD